MNESGRTLVANLEAVRELLRAGWCQGTWARNSEGRAMVSPRDAGAECFCLTGAVYKIASGHTAIVIFAAICAAGIPSRTSLVDFNDTHTKAEVIALVGRAIEASK